MDPINNINVHKYIDKKENLILIIKVVTGYYLAGFTADYF